MFKMLKIIFRNLWRGPATILYPFQEREYAAGARGTLKIEIEKCIFCGICGRKCPTAAIVVDRQNKAWEIDRLRCIACNHCVEVCPKKCLQLEPRHFGAVVGQTKESYHA